uniref:C-type lectin domain-containing protein n=1 Tax=Panagrolaimus superbus TaxID=310955 RepID=A0A914XTT3_9BILA
MIFIADLIHQEIPPKTDDERDVDCAYYQSWIGLYALTHNANWYWSDNTPFDYTGWSPNEPNNQGENCVFLMLHSGCHGEQINLWNNIICNLHEQNFVCKKQQTVDF